MESPGDDDEMSHYPYQHQVTGAESWRTLISRHDRGYSVDRTREITFLQDDVRPSASTSILQSSSKLQVYDIISSFDCGRSMVDGLSLIDDKS